MSSVWRKTLVYLGLVEEPEEYDDVPQRLDGGEVRVRDGGRRAGGQPQPAGQPRARQPAGGDDATIRPLRFPAEDGGAERRAPAGRGQPPRGGGGRAGPQVTVVEVARFDDCERIGEAYRAGEPVLFDLGGVDKGVARRVLDFVSGTTFALRGSLDRAGDGAFLLVPDGVTVPDEERQRLADLGYRPGA